MIFADTALVIITRNEEMAIAKVINDAKQILPGISIYVIDDSDDRTKEIATENGAIVRDGPRSGFGPAMFQALVTPMQPIIVTIDADDTYPVEALPILINYVRNGYDVAGANRLGFGRPRAMPIQNYFVNRVLSLAASVRAHRLIRDVHSGQRAYRREVLHQIDWEYSKEAFPIDLIYIPTLLKFRVIEIPIHYRERIGATTLERWPSGKASLKRLIRGKRSIRNSFKSDVLD